MITEVKRNRTPLPELFRCAGAPTRGLTVPAAVDRRAIDAAMVATREWAATRDDGREVDEALMFTVVAALYRQHIAPLRAELDQARAAADEAGRALAVAEAELNERREVERAARVRREMLAERRDKALVERVRQRDGDGCRYCGSEVEQSGPTGPGTAVLDHVAPGLAAGADNMVMACKPCRRRRAGKTLEAAGMTLLPVPESPRVADAPADANEADASPVAADLVAIPNPLTGRRLLALPRAEAVAWAEGILAQCAGASA